MVTDDRAGRRPRKKQTSAPAPGKRPDMMDLLEQIGKKSGVDDILFQLTDEETARKIISLARYLLVSGGQALPHIVPWQLRHPLPCGEGITEQSYRGLLDALSADEKLQRKFFRARSWNLRAGKDRDTPVTMAFDIKPFTANPGSFPANRYGFDGEYDEREPFRLLALFSAARQRPVSYTIQSGDLPDAVSLRNGMDALTTPELGAPELITDCGYYSKHYVGRLLNEGFHFITLARSTMKWISAEVLRNREEFRRYLNACPFDPNIYGICVPVRSIFDLKTQDVIEGANQVNITRTVYLYLYLNEERYLESRQGREDRPARQKDTVERGLPTGLEMTRARRATNRHAAYIYRVKNLPGQEDPGPDDDDLSCVLALVSDRNQDKWTVLEKYRQREFLEFFFSHYGQDADPAHFGAEEKRVKGRIFILFVSLCYREYLAVQERKVMAGLGASNRGRRRGTKPVSDGEKELLQWMKSTPLDLQLQWFDTEDSPSARTPFMDLRQSPEYLARDSLFLSLMGLGQGAG